MYLEKKLSQYYTEKKILLFFQNVTTLLQYRRCPNEVAHSQWKTSGLFVAITDALAVNAVHFSLSLFSLETTNEKV